MDYTVRRSAIVFADEEQERLKKEEETVTEQVLSNIIQTSLKSPQTIIGKVFDRIGFNAVQDEELRHLVISSICSPMSKKATVDYRKHSNKCTFYSLRFGCSFAVANTIKPQLPLKSYLQQIGVSYSTYHYWRKKCSVERNSIKQELAPISFKQAVTESSQEEQFPHGVALLFPNGLRAHFGSGSEEILMEVLTQSLRGGHV